MQTTPSQKTNVRPEFSEIFDPDLQVRKSRDLRESFISHERFLKMNAPGATPNFPDLSENHSTSTDFINGSQKGVAFATFSFPEMTGGFTRLYLRTSGRT
jgi:hypothetical protein